MRSLSRVLLASLLTGLVIGCQPKAEPGPSESAKPGRSEDAKPSNPISEKIKRIQEEPQGPQLRPK
jgi:hypothetical protein